MLEAMQRSAGVEEALAGPGRVGRSGLESMREKAKAQEGVDGKASPWQAKRGAARRGDRGDSVEGGAAVREGGGHGE